MKKLRKHLIFHGNVQGVGFRYRSYYLASSLGLTGWVKNQYDGTVEMEVQGDHAAIDDLILRLQQQPFLWIDQIEAKELPVISEHSFSIR